MNGLLLDRTGRTVHRLLESGAFERNGSHPMCPSGGALGVGNPIAATGLMKIAELYFQLSGQAGKRQVPKEVHRGLAQAWGDLMQVGTVVVMASEGSLPIRRSQWSEATVDDLPGTPLKSVADAPHIEYHPELAYAWDNGFALTTYLEGFRQGKIRASYCAGCDRMMIPARPFCEVCDLRAVDRYFDLPDTGTVQTYTISHVDWASLPLPEGKVNIFAVVAIDGAGERMGLVHLLGEVDPAEVRIGLRVKAVWKPEEERRGMVTDLAYFRPLLPGDEEGEAEAVMIKPEELTRATARAVPGRIPLDYAYTAGIAGRRFYADLAQGKLSGTWCPECEVVLVPPSAFCEECLERLDPEAQARPVDAGSGVVTAATLVFEDRMGHQMDAPVWVVQVEFPDCVGSVIGRLLTTPDDEVPVGLPVDIVLTTEVGPEHIAFRPAG